MLSAYTCFSQKSAARCWYHHCYIGCCSYICLSYCDVCLFSNARARYYADIASQRFCTEQPCANDREGREKFSPYIGLFAEKYGDQGVHKCDRISESDYHQ